MLLKSSKKHTSIFVTFREENRMKEFPGKIIKKKKILSSFYQSPPFCFVQFANDSFSLLFIHLNFPLEIPNVGCCSRFKTGSIWIKIYQRTSMLYPASFLCYSFWFSLYHAIFYNRIILWRRNARLSSRGTAPKC